MEDSLQKIVLTEPVAEGTSATFTYHDSCGLVAEGLVFRRHGRLYAYRNLCRHQPLALDYGDGDFFTDDRQYLLCRNHGALFQPETGFCVSGPCSGACLFVLEAVDNNGAVEVTIPVTTELDLE